MSALSPTDCLTRGMSSTWLLVAVLVVAFFGAMLLAASETALLRISKARASMLRQQRGRRGARLAALIGDLPRVLNTILLLELLAQIASATVTGMLASQWFGSVGVTIASIVLTMLLFVYAEAIPKTFAVRHADRVALRVASIVSLLATLMKPVVSVLVWVADLQAPGKGIAASPTITEHELRWLARSAAAEGEIDVTDREMIERAFRFGDRRADDIMVPRTDIVGIPSASTIEQAIDVAVQSGHRHLIVHKGTLDDILGVVSLRVLVAVPTDRRGITVDHLTARPLIVPRSKHITALLREMQSDGTHLAVVIDEYGGTAGLVTIEDIAEELIGSVTQDELIRTGDAWSVAGLLPVEDLREALGTDLPDGDWNTTGGLVVGLLERLPQVGDEVTAAGYRFRITSMRGHRIHRIEVTAV
jgi:putative hemolysin